jgi:hypothetical protein
MKIVVKKVAALTELQIFCFGADIAVLTAVVELLT